jgi:DNA-binding PadR family transcriptional regulator
MVTAEQADERRVYRLTEAGQAELTAHATLVQAVWDRFPSEQTAGGRHEFAFLRDELDDLARTVMAGLQDAWRRGDVEQARRLRQALERCKSEVRELIARVAPSQAPSPQSPPDGTPRGEMV